MIVLEPQQWQSVSQAVAVQVRREAYSDCEFQQTPSVTGMLVTEETVSTVRGQHSETPQSAKCDDKTVNTVSAVSETTESAQCEDNTVNTSAKPKYP